MSFAQFVVTLLAVSETLETSFSHENHKSRVKPIEEATALLSRHGIST
jgi:hypothetical protein